MIWSVATSSGIGVPQSGVTSSRDGIAWAQLFVHRARSRAAAQSRFRAPRGAPQKGMRVVHGLDTGQLVVEAALRDFAANAQRGQMRAHGGPQVVNRECVQPMVDGGEGRAHGVDADM